MTDNRKRPKEAPDIRVIRYKLYNNYTYYV